jgi:hypothetical protein
MKMPFRRKKSMPQRIVQMLGGLVGSLVVGLKKGTSGAMSAERTSGKRLRRATDT